ncbi:MAG: sigma54 specific transcriptional regulator, Fis family [Polyangiaceae bacterium]|nr:sigma54 specific transcriptional regulator, Fis family [Polyangiaceae bacterium]
MRAQDMDHKELLELDPEAGLIRFAGRRALLIDAVAMGLLRKYLVENFGQTAARTVLTQFGFAHGWRMAEALQTQLKWDADSDWRDASTRIHALEGLFRVAAGSASPLSKEGLMIESSYEAEQHLLHFGRADEAACWTISGLISGYLSRSSGKETYVLEDRCLGKGDVACHLFGRTREEWGSDRSEELHFFEPRRLKDCLDVSLRRVTETLKLAERKLRDRRRALIRVTREVVEPYGIVARSSGMQRVVDLARRVAKVDATVLITGESGSGKERIARLVHEESTRATGPFVAVNCGAIAETLLEAELFGHARGAFTGASQDRPGLFEAAQNGTLLLDEVGEVSPGMQVKLLRVLQEREVRRVGENRVRRIDVRVLAATNRDLANAVAGGTFRTDLYYRLKVVELHVPPLRERRDDVLPLARVLLGESALQMKRSVVGLGAGAADQLLRYDWPGNVRELENAMERAVALCTGNRIEVEDLPEDVRQARPATTAQRGAVRRLAEVEKEYIISALEVSSGNQTRTAELLGIGTATLYRKLKSYGLIADRSPPQLRLQLKGGVQS